MKADIEQLHDPINAEFELLRGEVRQSEQRLIIRLGALAISLTGLHLGALAIATAIILRAV